MNFITQTDNCGPLSSSSLKTDKETDFYRHLLYNFESSRSSIDGYNYFIENILPNIFLGEYYIKTSNSTNELQIVKRVIIDFPKNNRSERINPRMARSFGISYMCSILLEIEIPNNTYGSSKTIQHIGSIPCMIGSNRCYTTYKPDEFKTIEDWKMYCSECPTSTGGYFINKGMEKVIINQEKIRTCIYMTVKSKEKISRILTTITCINKSETTIVRLQSGRKRPTVRVLLPITKGKHYPLYLVIYLLLIKQKKINNSSAVFSFDKIDDIICSFVPKNEHDEVKIALLPNRNKFNENFVNEDNRIDDSKIRLYTLKKISIELSFESIVDSVFTDCFKQCFTIDKKIANLCYMVAQHIRCFLENRKFDSRDSWLNKKVDAPQRTIELLVNAIFAGPHGMKFEENFKLMKKSPDVMADTFKTSFNSYQWGYKNSKKENVSEAIKNDSYLAFLGQLSKINTPVDRRIKSSTVRGVSTTQMGIICPVETPEGETCGLVKHLSALTHVSYNRFYEKGRTLLLEEMYNTNDYSSSFTKGENCKFLLYIENDLVKVEENGVEYPLYVSRKFVDLFKKKLSESYPDSKDWIKFIKKGDDGMKIKINIANKIESVIIEHWSNINFSIDIPNTLFDIFSGVFSIINNFFSTANQLNYIYSFSINGDIFIRNENQFYPTIIYVCEELITELKIQRRNKILPIDSCIYKNDSDNIVQYYDDSGRCMTPYLIVDIDGQLIADKKFLWDRINSSDYQNSKDYMNLFYDEGAMELIDVKEYNSIFLANTIEEVRAFSKLRSFLEKNLKDEIIIDDELYTKGKTIIDIRECDNYIASIRRSYDYLLLLPDSIDGFKYLQNDFKFLEDFSIFYKLHVYLNTRFMFTHSFINPNSIFSAGANVAPKGNHQPGPRFTYQAAMAKQSLSLGNLVDYTRFDAAAKKQIMSRRSSFETIAEQPLLLNNIPVTQNVVIMVGSHKNNYEDPTVMSRSYANRMMRYQKDEVYKTRETITSQYRDNFIRPDNDINNNNKNRYRHIGPDGIPKLGSIIKAGDCIIGKVRTIISTGEQKSTCIFAGIGDLGEVIGIQISCGEDSSDNYRTLCVKISQRRYQIVGDKLASRYAQKGVIGDIIGGENEETNYLGKVIDDNEMPMVRGGPNHGLKPDLIFNPIGFPSRMTCGKWIEILSSKASLYTDERVDATNFKHLDINYYHDILENAGLDKFGNEFMSHSDGEIMMDSTTGKEYKAYVGMCSYQILRHQVKDKIQSRALGKNDPFTRQASKGRSLGGGLRLGNMELDSFVAHGASYLAVERLMISSDEYKTIYCTNCNQISADAPLNVDECRFCKKINTLVTGIHPRVFLCFSQIMLSMGVVVKTILKRKK